MFCSLNHDLIHWYIHIHYITLVCGVDDPTTLYLRMKVVSTVQSAGVHVPHVLIAYDARVLIIVDR